MNAPNADTERVITLRFEMLKAKDDQWQMHLTPGERIVSMSHEGGFAWVYVADDLPPNDSSVTP